MVEFPVYHLFGSSMNKKIYLICHGFGEQIFLEGILNKYFSDKTYIPIKTMSPNSNVHKSSVQINNLVEVCEKSLITYRKEIVDNVKPYIICMIDSEERDQDANLEKMYVNGDFEGELAKICEDITGVIPEVLCLYSVKGIENAIKEVYPNLQKKKGVTHIKLAKPYLSVELFTQEEYLRNSNLYKIKGFVDNEIL